MRLLCLILLLLGCVSPAILAAKPVFQLGVSSTQYLPPPMYGTWQVRASLLSSNNPAMFPPTSLDIWTLTQEGQIVTLVNPGTGASATINVTQVEGNRARFTHRAEAGRNTIIEENPVVTVNNDHLFGQTQNRMLITRKGQTIQIYVATYRLDAVRIGGSRVKFGQPFEQAGDYPDFEIAPLKPLPAKPLAFPFNSTR